MENKLCGISFMVEDVIAGNQVPKEKDNDNKGDNDDDADDLCDGTGCKQMPECAHSPGSISRSNEKLDWNTREAKILETSDCNIVGNKLNNLIPDESHMAKWEKFKSMAGTNGNLEECSILLKKDRTGRV